MPPGLRPGMAGIRRRATYYVLGMALLILASTGIYEVGMRVFEPRPYPPPGTEVSFLHSLQVVVETITATGYGSDAPWTSAEMNLLVTALELTGVGVFFLGLPAVFLPLFRDLLQPSVPTTVASDLEDHVIICTPTARAEALIAELEAYDIEPLVLEPDADRAASLRDRGRTIMHGDPESIDDLRAANLDRARALVADLADRTDTSIVLAAREIDESVPIVSVVDESSVEAYHRLAGADHVVTPRRALGRSMASKLTTAIDPDAGDAIDLGERLDLLEVPIHHGSDLAGGTLEELRLRDRFGVNVIGAWFRGEFDAPPAATRRLEPGTVLLVGGAPNNLNRLRGELGTPVRDHRRGETVVLGHGEVGRVVREALEDAGIPVTVVDRDDQAAVDVVGDATVTETLRAAGVPDARAVVIALGDDKTTQFATLVVRELTDTVEIIARANTSESVRKSYRAGGDYVLSLATVSGRSIAGHILERGEILSIGTNIEVVRTSATALEGRTIQSARVRERTGCTVVAIERDEELITDVSPTFRIEPGDALVIAGTDAGTNRFATTFK